MITFQIKSSPEGLSGQWDQISSSCFQQTAFLKHAHKYNYCSQRYYEMYDSNKLVAIAIVYTLPVNLFTFSGLSLTLTMNVLGIPVSVAAEPVAGDPIFVSRLLEYIRKSERGLLLGLNLIRDYRAKGIVNLRTLPSIIFHNKFNNFQSYVGKLRYPYRRKIRLSQRRFHKVESKETSCSKFGREHYKLYESVMSRTKTKLEKLRIEFFQHLPKQYILTTHYYGHNILCWNICVTDKQILYFFLGGMNYELRDAFRSYHNNLLSILYCAFLNKTQTIDFGQTAELVKLRLGGSLSERRMFIYHHNRLIRWALKITKGLIDYATVTDIPNVFTKMKNSDEDYFYSSKAM